MLFRNAATLTTATSKSRVLLRHYTSPAGRIARISSHRFLCDVTWGGEARGSVIESEGFPVRWTPSALHRIPVVGSSSLPTPRRSGTFLFLAPSLSLSLYVFTSSSPSRSFPSMEFRAAKFKERDSSTSTSSRCFFRNREPVCSTARRFRVSYARGELRASVSQND